MQFPLILARDLPLGSPTIGTGDTIPVIRGTGRTERISADALAASYINYIDSAPTSPNVIGKENAIAIDRAGIYSYKEGTWGKSPRVTTHWEDLDENSRFLLTNRALNLSEQEIKNVRESIDIKNATTDNSGLVKLATSIDANDGGVLTGQQVIDYVSTQLESITGEITSTSSKSISNYTGDVLIKGPNGELLMTYNTSNKTLYLGSDSVNVVIRSKNGTQVQNSNDTTIATIN